jgi:hypothetical protein
LHLDNEAVRTVTVIHEDSGPRSFEDIEREFIAELAKSNTDALRKAHRRISLILSHAEDQEKAREQADVLSLLLQ